MTTTVSAAALNAIYNWVVLGTATSTEDRFIGLLTDVPAATEVTGGDYARVDATTVMGAPTSGVGSDTTAITFASAGPTCTVTGVAFYDDATAGALVMKAPLVGDATQAFTAGEAIAMPIGLLIATIVGA
jgi:hypothetical protein